MMAAHSEKGPSSSSRWIHCTPSAKLCADMPDQSTGYAEQGTMFMMLFISIPMT